MDLFKIKISNDGKLIDQAGDKLSLVDDSRGLLQTVK